MSVKEIKVVTCDECGRELTGKMLAVHLEKTKKDFCLKCFETSERVNAAGEIVVKAQPEMPPAPVEKFPELPAEPSPKTSQADLDWEKLQSASGK